MQSMLLEWIEAMDNNSWQPTPPPDSSTIRLVVYPHSDYIRPGRLETINPLFDPTFHWVIDIDRLLTQSELKRLPTRLINICGNFFAGKSTVANVLTKIWPERLKLLPEAKVETFRPLRPGEKRGRDVILYKDEEAFKEAARLNKFFLAYRYKRMGEDEWQWAGIRLSDIKKAVAARTQHRSILLLNGEAWDVLLEAIPGLHGLVVLGQVDLNRPSRGGRLGEGNEMDIYGTRLPRIEDSEERHIYRYRRGFAPLPNPWVSDPLTVLEHRYRDPEVYEYLRRAIFWDEVVREQRVHFESGEEVDEVDEVRALSVLWGIREPDDPVGS